MILKTKRVIVDWEEKSSNIVPSDTPVFTIQGDPKEAVKETEAMAGEDVIG